MIHKLFPPTHFWQWFILLAPIAVGLMFWLARWLDKVDEEPLCGCGSGKYESECKDCAGHWGKPG
jgi:hypothetical protein